MNILIIKTEGRLTRDSGLNEKYLNKIKAVSPEITVDFIAQDEPQFSQLIHQAEVIITTRLAFVNFQDSPNLKWIHIITAGLNNLPEDLAKSDIVITNSSGVHPVPISEHVLSFMLMLTRKFNVTFRNQVEGKWVREVAGIEELAGKIVTIVGLGHIGSRVAKLCKAFEMTVYGIVRNPDRTEQWVDRLVGNGELDELLKESDFIINCLPSTEETRGLFNFEKFRKLKQSSYFINIGRGDTVVEKDLVKALQDGLLAGAGLDVFETEPLPENSPLWQMENVIITPHISGLSPKYLDRMIDIFVENLKCFIDGKTMPNLVDKKLGY
jgi:D-2-hydroxyacid dehydrogenase (NADP+)